MTRLFVLPALAALLAALPARVPAPMPDPTCTGSLNGGSLTTMYALPNGYRLEGLWQVRFNEAPADGRRNAVATSMVLHRLREFAGSREPVTIPLSEPWRLEITDQQPVDAMNRVVKIWCEAVLNANSAGTRLGWAQPLRQGRIT